MIRLSSLLALGFCALAVGCSSHQEPAAHGAGNKAGVHAADPSLTGDQAWAKLAAGNQRFISGKLSHPNQTIDRRMQTTAGQHPFAIILACADSRVGPEVVFDQGVGDLFVVRVAGNIADDAVLGSIEYAAEHLHAPLIVVMGHAKCGAVTAAADSVAKNSTPPGHLPALIDPIKPAVKAQTPGDKNLVEKAIDANVQNVVQKIKTSGPILDHLVKEGKVKVVGGRYDLATGEFKLLAAN